MLNNKYYPLYSKYIKDLKVRGVEWRGSCPFHKETTPGAFAVNSETGLYFCHSCGVKGNAATFAKYFGEEYYKYYPDFKYKVGNVDLNKVNRYQSNLISNPDLIPKIWDLDLVQDLKIGYNFAWGTLVFPIFDISNNILNLKNHKGIQTKGSHISLYPLNLASQYEHDYIVVCEGEKDCVTLLSKDIQAVTGTGGAINVPRDLSVLDRFFYIYICFDNDETGIAGVEKWAQAIKKLESPKLVKIADIGQYVKDGGDITDYFNHPWHNREKFCRNILDRARYYQPFTDIPDFIRRVMLSEKFKSLSMRDQNVFTTLIPRANRYFSRTPKIKGKQINIGPGEFYTSIKRLKICCASDITEKQVRSAIESLQNKGFIRSEDLKAKRGRLISILEWEEIDGQANGLQKNRKYIKRNYPFFRGEDNGNKY